MKTKKVRPVLIEVSEYISKYPFLVLKDGKLFLYNKENPSDFNTIIQELILISLEDENFKEGDVYFCKYGNTIDFITKDNYISESHIRAKTFNKVIARQSQIPPDYIPKFVEQYNDGCIEDLEIEMEFGIDYSPDIATEHKGCYIQPKVSNGFVTIVEKESEKDKFDKEIMEHVFDNAEDWEAKLAIKNIPELPHPINSVRELRRYYIDGIQVGYEIRKSEESTMYNEEEVLQLLLNAKLATYDSLYDWFQENKKK